eukprot:2851611-Rhodomonas_salina.2
MENNLIQHTMDISPPSVIGPRFTWSLTTSNWIASAPRQCWQPVAGCSEAPPCRRAGSQE